VGGILPVLTRPGGPRESAVGWLLLYERETLQQ